MEHQKKHSENISFYIYCTSASFSSSPELFVKFANLMIFDNSYISNLASTIEEKEQTIDHLQRMVQMLETYPCQRGDLGETEVGRDDAKTLIYQKYNANGVNMCSVCGGTASADYRDVMARLEASGILYLFIPSAVFIFFPSHIF